jgi:hypothetical protein
MYMCIYIYAMYAYLYICHGNDLQHLLQFAVTMRQVMVPLATIAGAIGPHLAPKT